MLEIYSKIVKINTPELTRNHEDIRREVSQAILDAAEKSKREYDQAKNVKSRDIDGKKVYWKNFTANPIEGKHLAPWFRDPFLAEKTESSWNYKITDKDGNSKTVNVDQLKDCHNVATTNLWPVVCEEGDTIGFVLSYKVFV